MTSDLRTQVRDYTDFFVSTVEALDLGEITERPIGIGEGQVRPLRRLPTSNRHRGWLVAMAAAAAVVILVGGAALLLRIPGSDAPVATPPPTGPPSSLNWIRVNEYQGSFGGDQWQELFSFSVTAGGPGLVAVGGVDLDAAVWTSRNGVNWSRVPHRDAVFGQAQMQSVTAGGPGLVAVGLAWGPTSNPEGPPPANRAVVWTSPDGITWSRAPNSEAVFEGVVMTSVVVGGPGLVAVGYDGHPGYDGFPEGETSPVVWTSPDGLTWSRVPIDETVFGGDHVGISSVIAGGPGLVAVGSDGTSAAFWTSPDGVTWSRVPHDESVFGGDLEVSSVMAGGPGLVAVGSDGKSAAVWTSPDGIIWSRVPHDEAVFGAGPDRPGLDMSSITVGGPGLVVVGGNSTWGGTDGVVWVATPGG